MARDPNRPNGHDTFPPGIRLASGMENILMNQPGARDGHRSFNFEGFAPGVALVPNERGVNERIFRSSDLSKGVLLGVLYNLDFDDPTALQELEDVDEFRSNLKEIVAPCFTFCPLDADDNTEHVKVWEENGIRHHVPPAVVTLPTGENRQYSVVSMYVVSRINGRILRLTKLWARDIEDDEDLGDLNVVSGPMQQLLSQYGGSDNLDPHYCLLATQAVDVSDVEELEMLGAYLYDIERGNLQPQIMRWPDVSQRP